MALQQRFSGDEYYYEMEETFLEELEQLPPLYSAGIIMQLDKFASEMQEETRVTNKPRRFGMIAGVVALADPLFFSVEYLNSKSMFPLFYKFNIISSDDYLDYLNLNKTITYANDTNTKTAN
jgi:hypothetical protein|tara:strand:+ start:455 stop:820 length:366 start_codon:yes stop_codon:yes gene_type:complete